MTTNGKVLVAEAYDDSLAERVEWLWKNRLVAAAFNLIIGEEKVGKGTLVAWLISQITRGKFEIPPSNVGVIGYEDSWRKVWIPRLSSVNAKPRYVHNLKLQGGGQLNVREDMDLLLQAIKKLKIKVLYIDQLLDNLSLGTDSHHQKQVRNDLSPIQALTEESGVTVIGTMHPNKRGTSFREWQAGSAAFTAVARSTLALCRHPEDSEKRVVVVARSNYGATGYGMQFNIASGEVKVRASDGRHVRTSVGHVVNREPCDLMVDELLDIGPRQQRSTQLEHKLKELLSQNGGMKSTDLLAACSEAGFGEQMVRRAAKRLGVRVFRSNYESIWKLLG